ncbi:hypothetical protein ABPG75_012610 [Micractinium tetrahymenae]
MLVQPTLRAALLAAAALCALAGAAAATATPDELGLASQAHHNAWREGMLTGSAAAGAGRGRHMLVDLAAIPEKPGLSDEVDIGIITAFSPEVQSVLDRMDSILGKKTYSGRAFFIGKLGKKTVAVTTSGESMVNAALTTQLFCDKFVSKLVFSGIAGGVDPSNNIGDVVIPATWIQPHQQRYIRPLESSKYFYYPGKGATITDDTFKQLASGEYASFTRPGTDQCTASLSLAKLAAYKKSGVVTTGFALPIPVQILTSGLDIFKGTVPAKFNIYVDPGLLATAKKVASTVKLSRSYTVPGTNTTFTLGTIPKIKVGGVGMSSSTFVDNAEYRKDLYETLKAESCDMESTAFIQVCATNKKACIVIRSLSDLAGGDADGNQVSNFFGLASYHSSLVLTALVKAA